MDLFKLVKPKLLPPLDEAFRPAVLANRAFEKEVADIGVPLIIGMERANGEMAQLKTRVFSEGHPRADANLMYVERLVKFLLWQRGGYKVYIGGPRSAGEYVRQC